MQKLYQGLGHIAIHTRDMDGSIAFYEKIGGSLSRRETVSTPDGEKQLALVSFAGFLLELIQSPVPVPMGEGNIPHFAVYVDDVDAAAFRPWGWIPSWRRKRRCGPTSSAGWKTVFSPVPPGSRSSFCTCSDTCPKREKTGRTLLGTPGFCVIADGAVSRRAAVPAR